MSNNEDSEENDQFLIENAILFKKYKLIKKLGGGAFGDIYLGMIIKDGSLVAIKTEPRKVVKPQLETEAFLLYTCKGTGIPEVLSFGKTKSFNVLVEPYIGKSLFHIYQENNKEYKLTDLCMIAIQIIDRLEFIHSKNIIHRDIKPDNFLIGEKDPNVLYLIDFGLSKKYRSSKTGRHINFGFTGKLTGTVRYASANTLRGGEQSRRDDLESVGYMLVFFLKKKLPWQSVTTDNKMERYVRIYRMKKKITPEKLCEGLPSEICDFIKYSKSLEFEQEPNYNYLRGLFRNVIKKAGYNQEVLIFSWANNFKNKIKIPINLSSRRSSPQKRLYNQIQKNIKEARSNAENYPNSSKVLNTVQANIKHILLNKNDNKTDNNNDNNDKEISTDANDINKNIISKINIRNYISNNENQDKRTKLNEDNTIIANYASNIIENLKDIDDEKEDNNNDDSFLKKTLSNKSSKQKITQKKIFSIKGYNFSDKNNIKINDHPQGNVIKRTNNHLSDLYFSFGVKEPQNDINIINNENLERFTNSNNNNINNTNNNNNLLNNSLKNYNKINNLINKNNLNEIDNADNEKNLQNDALKKIMIQKFPERNCISPDNLKNKYINSCIQKHNYNYNQLAIKKNKNVLDIDIPINQNKNGIFIDNHINNININNTFGNNINNNYNGYNHKNVCLTGKSDKRNINYLSNQYKKNIFDSKDNLKGIYIKKKNSVFKQSSLHNISNDNILYKKNYKKKEGFDIIFNNKNKIYDSSYIFKKK